MGDRQAGGVAVVETERVARELGGMSSETRGVLGREQAVGDASLRSRGLRADSAPTQAAAERVDGSDDLPDTRVGPWARHELAGARSAASPQVAHRLEAFQEALPGLSALQSTAVPEPVACGHVTALDDCGCLAGRSVRPRPDVLRARTGGRHGLHIRLMIVSDDLLREDLGALAVGFRFDMVKWSEISKRGDWLRAHNGGAWE